MSKPQSLESIKPMQHQEKAEEKPKDPVQEEFDEGKRFLEQEEFSQAAACFHNVLRVREEQKDEAGIANACNQLGHVCLMKQEYDLAEKHYKRAWDICDKLNDFMSLLAVEHKFLEVYRGRKEYDKAIRGCLDLMDKYRDLNNPQASVAILETLASIFIDSGNKAGAADAYRTIASIHKNFKHEKYAERYEQKAVALEC